MTTTGDLEFEDLLKMAKKAHGKLVTMLPSEVNEMPGPRISRSVSRAHLLRAGLLHRTADIAGSTIQLCADQRPMPALLLGRAVFETVAVYYSFYEHMRMGIGSPDVSSRDRLIDAFIRGLEAWRDEGPQADDMLTAVDRLDHFVKGARKMYNTFRRVTYPGWTGTFAHYSGVPPHLVGYVFDSSHSWLPLEMQLWWLPALLDGVVKLDSSLRDILATFVGNNGE